MSAALIGAGLDAFTNLITTSMTNQANNNINKDNIIAQIMENQKNRDWQSKENLKANQWQEKMWNMQNEYNTPLAQRKRLQDAGYNPWISGSGGPQSLAGSAGSGAHGGAAQVGVGSSIAMVPPNLGGFMQALVANSGIANQNAQTVQQACKAYTEYLKSTGDYKGGLKLLKSLLAGVNRSDSYIGDLTNSLNYDYIRTKLAADRESVQYEIESQFGRLKAHKELNVLDSTILKIDAETNYLKAQKNVSDQQVKESAERVKKLIEETLTVSQSREFIVKKLQYEADILENDPLRSGLFASGAKSGPVLKFIIELLKLLK